MTHRHPTAPARSRKPAKPSKPQKDFPLFAHNNGQWSKKVRGKIHHFGVWADPQAALKKWIAQKDALLAGLTPRTERDALSIGDLANHFLTSKQRILDAGEIKQRTWDELYATCQRLVATFGKDRLVIDLASGDFEVLRSGIAEVWGPIRLGNEIQRVRSVFKYAWESGLIENPVRFGPNFKRPSRKVMRKLRADNGPRMFEAEEIRDMLAAANVQLKAMLLLGINAGYGNEDCAALPIAALNLDCGWVRFARPKTGIDRKCKLWPETVEALQEVLALRREPNEEDHKGILFITKYGRPWSNGSNGATAVTHETQKLLVALGIKRPGLNFYALRHTFRTVADGARDQPATDLIMGHARDEDMATHYRERIEDERLEAVAEHVRKWLYAKPTKAKARKTNGT